MAIEHDLRNPHKFKLVWDSTQRILPVEGSELLCIGLAVNSGVYYAALVHPVTQVNYTLYANLSNSVTGHFKMTYAEIEDEKEHRAIDDFFLKAGTFELYYKGMNWDFPIKPIQAKDAGTKTNNTRLPDGRLPATFGKKNIYEQRGNPQIPNWFKRRFMDR